MRPSATASSRASASDAAEALAWPSIVTTGRAGAVGDWPSGGQAAPVGGPTKGLGADRRRGARLPGAQRAVGDRQREDEAGAPRLHVDRGAPLHAEPPLRLDGGGGEGVVGG